jgi:hypothetical protein
MFPSLYILTLIAQFTDTPKPPTLDRAEVTQSGQQGEFSWSDAEDKVTGSFSPGRPKGDAAVDVVVRVGNMHGTPFDGPVTLTLKPQTEGAGETRTVSMLDAPKAWTAQLKAGEAGPYWLEVGYSTTRRKVVRVEVTVADAGLPRWPWYVMGGALGVLALVLGVRAVIGTKS